MLCFQAGVDAWNWNGQLADRTRMIFAFFDDISIPLQSSRGSGFQSDVNKAHGLHSLVEIRNLVQHKLPSGLPNKRWIEEQVESSSMEISLIGGYLKPADEEVQRSRFKLIPVRRAAR
jgi:hypothetical protein